MINGGRAFLAGVVGGAVMMLSTMPGLQPGTGAFVLGLLIHLLISGAIALVYAWAFDNLTHRSGAALGAGFGVIHGLIGGIFMGMVPMMHPSFRRPCRPRGPSCSTWASWA